MQAAGEVQDHPATLTAAAASRRAELLGTLGAALAARGVESLLACRHRLVLRADRPCGPCDPADPRLYVFGPGGTEVVATDGGQYRFASGAACPVAEPARAAGLVAGGEPGRPERDSMSQMVPITGALPGPKTAIGRLRGRSSRIARPSRH